MKLLIRQGSMKQNFMCQNGKLGQGFLPCKKKKIQIKNMQMDIDSIYTLILNGRCQTLKKISSGNDFTLL